MEVEVHAFTDVRYILEPDVDGEGTMAVIYYIDRKAWVPGENKISIAVYIIRFDCFTRAMCPCLAVIAQRRLSFSSGDSGDNPT